MRSNPAPVGHDRQLARARAGETGALGQLLEGYKHYLTLLAELQLDRTMRAKVGVSDVVQETFLDALRDFGQFRGETPAEFASWLRQVLARNLVNQIRQYRGTRRRDIRLEQELAAVVGESSAFVGACLIAPTDPPGRQADRHEAAVRLADALAQLPTDYRDVLVLRYLHELSFPEVADRMCRTLDSVKKLWVRGLIKLRALMPEPV
jgi:RNA polymerase sigma-70 factor (ECF subfamily)